jgi:hypothetical protein
MATMTSTVSFEASKKEKANPKKDQMDKLLSQFRKGSIPVFGGKFNLNLNKAQADGDETCEAILDDAWDLCDSMWTTYEHGALKYFNNSLCWLNKGATANVENVLCHFDKSMGINPNLNALPQTINKTFGAMSVSVTISEPIEAFAISEGYEAKGVVTVDGNVYMVLYWGGNGTSSKGFMIEGDVAGLGGDRAVYTKWDLTNETAQTVQLLSADYPSGTYLNNVSSGERGDHTIFGSVTYNNVSSAVTTQMVLIANQRGASAGAGFGCFKMYASGVKGGNIVVTKTRDEIASDNFNDTGHPVSNTDLNFANMDGAQLEDDPATTNGTGNLGGASAADMQTNIETALGIAPGTNIFEKSCNDLNTAGSAGVFSTAGTAVDFDLGPDDVF